MNPNLYRILWPCCLEHSSHTKDLRDIQLELWILLQYVDNILLTSNTYKACLNNTITVLNPLAKKEDIKCCLYKAQICKQEVAYLWFQLKQATRSLMTGQKQAIGTIKIPEDQKQFYGFLEIIGICQIWIPNFGLIAEPLHNSLKGLNSAPLECRRDCQVAFDTLKEKLFLVSALFMQKPRIRIA